MYPDFPASPSDLVPLPLCDGPKLDPFDFEGPQEIEFLEYLGEGTHSHVVQVRISVVIYALKLFRFVSDEWLSIARGAFPSNRRDLTAFMQYSEPFNAECRAFGRLKEAGYENLAIRCFGYVLLSEMNEAALKNKFRNMRLSFNGDRDDELPENHAFSLRTRFSAKGGKRPPIRGILKEFGEEPGRLTNRDFTRTRQSVMSIQQLGIVGLDVHPRQFISGKLADFSTAYTTPHFALNPELNPGLTPGEVSMVEFEAFRVSVGDYWMFDHAVSEYNEDERCGGGERRRRHEITVGGIPGSASFPRRYNLRRKSHREGFYTYVNPRAHDWKGWKGIERGDGEEEVSKGPSIQRVLPRWHYLCDNSRKAMRLRRGGGLDKLLFQRRDGRFFPKSGE